MTMILTITATAMVIVLIAALTNIYSVSEFAYIVARWAIALWVFTVVAALYALAAWTAGYFTLGTCGL